MNHCLHCNKPLTSEYSIKFCNRSCSTSYNNKNRAPRSDESRIKSRNAAKTYISSLSDTEYVKYMLRADKHFKIIDITIPIDKKLLFDAKKQKLHNPNHEILGEFTKIFLCTCKYTGIKWYSTTCKQIHPSVINTKKEYEYQCRFNFSISKYHKWFNNASHLIQKHGWYSTPGSSRNGVTNINGISRDHLYSVSDGFKNNINPILLSHPANCNLLPHSENQSKGKRSTISLTDLKERISKFESLYGESIR